MNAPTVPEVLDRSTYFGSSDAAAVLGISKWGNPLTVYRRKVDPASLEEDDEEKRKILRRGTLLEPVIRAMAVEDYGLEVVGVNRRHSDPEFLWMRAEIDFETRDPDGTVVNNDCKSVSPFVADQWGESDTDEIPIEYHAQFQFGMMVTGSARCDVWALFGADKLVRYVVYRDDEVIAGMRRKVVAFWHDHVLARVPPAPVTVDDVEYLMRRLQGRKVYADPAVLELVQQYRAAKYLAKSTEDEIETLKFQIVDYIHRETVRGAGGRPDGEDAVLVHPEDGKALLSWKKQSTDRIDVKRIKAEAPEVAAEYIRTTTGRVLRLA